MPKITINKEYNTLTVEREDGDPKFYGVVNAKGESNFLYYLKNILNKEPYNLNLIKKRMWKDGHLVDEMQQYLRSKKILKGKPYYYIWNMHWAITGLDEDWNGGKAVLGMYEYIGGEN